MDSENSSDDDVKYTPPAEIGEATKMVSLEMIPERTRRNYELAYNAFIEWLQKNYPDSFSEETLYVYFKKLAKKYRSTTLWTRYSMLKNTIFLKHEIDIEPYLKVRELLKRESEGYQAKKSESFTGEQINKFLKDAPDNKYLAIKVALIMGKMGACYAHELFNIKMQDLKFFDGCMQVTVPPTTVKVSRNFTVTDDYYHIVKRYADIREQCVPSIPFLFLNFQNGTCSPQRVGINKIGAMGKDIAKFLKISNPENYTGHCFRRSSATLRANESVRGIRRFRYTKSTNMSSIMVNNNNLCGNGNNTTINTKQSSTLKDTNECKTGNNDSINTANIPPTIKDRTLNASNNSPTVNDKDNSLRITRNDSTFDIDISNTPTIHFTNCNNITKNFLSK